MNILFLNSKIILFVNVCSNKQHDWLNIYVFNHFIKYFNNKILIYIIKLYEMGFSTTENAFLIKKMKECMVCATWCPFGAHFLQHKLNCFNLDEDSLKNIFLSCEATLYFINAYPKKDTRVALHPYHLFHSPYINLKIRGGVNSPYL